jgi:hypothetical protein
LDATLPSSYKSGVYLELHRFKDARRYNRGWELSLAELRALSVVTVLLDQSNYEGNQEPREIEEYNWRYLKKTPVLSFNWKQYLDIYYGSKSSEHQGQQVQLAKHALESLCNRELRITYYRKKEAHRIHWTGPILINATRNPALRSNRKEVKLIYHPIFVDRTSTFHVQKPVSLLQDIQNYLGKKRIKKPVILFIEWLLTKNNNPSPLERKSLIERLWLEDLLQSRHSARLEAVLQECFDTAKGLGYLLEDAREESGMIFLNLNPEKCLRFKVSTSTEK